jgi:large subunit ribosomal protein L6
MSRIGKLPVPVPKNVKVTLAPGKVAVEGPKGRLERTLPEVIAIKQQDGELVFERPDDDFRNRALHGLVRSLVANMVEGVTKGYEKRLEITGVGYRAAAQGKVLKLSLGYSHEIDFAAPDGVAITTPKPTEIVLAGIDKQRVGQAAAEIRSLRPPEPYKGKGVKYAGEFIFRKEGKKK